VNTLAVSPLFIFFSFLFSFFAFPDMPNGIVAEQFLTGPKVVLLSYTGEVKIFAYLPLQKKLREPRKSSFMNKMAGEWTHKQAGGEKGESSHKSASPVIA
jgi:hypothetical protein